MFTVSCDSEGDTSTTEPDPSPAPSPNPDPPDQDIENAFSLVNAFPNLSFDRPLDIQNSGDGTNRIFIVEQRGVIQVVDNIPAQNQNVAQRNTETSEVFLDIQNQVLFDESELGLLGLAFHPDYENNGLFYINYIADGPLRSVISQFSVSDEDPNLADPNSEVILLEFPQPHPFHNGGQLVFGPMDGYLYISMGDGGPASGANGNSQDLTNLLGTVIRIDVDNPEGGENYGIPSDNPFSGNMSGFREEIFAYGLRNPWRISFNPVTGDLWTGDVGESSREEINIIENGKNYGWPIMEGSLCFDPPMGCGMNGLELPLFEYGRDQGGSIIGGMVYNGNQLPELLGLFIYSDFVSGRVWALENEGTNLLDNTQLLQFDPFSIVSFGLNEQGEPYIASFDGNIYRLERIEDM